MAPRLRPVAYDALTGWAGDDHLAALMAFRKSARHALGSEKAYRTGTLGVTPQDLGEAMAESLSNAAVADPRGFFERHFRPVRIEDEPGFVTAYYEPEIDVADEPDDVYRFPFYRKPRDLVKITPADAPDLAARGFEYARRSPDGLTEYPDRGEIEQGFLRGRSLEIAWAADRVDVFFVHIQGSARLLHRNGRVRRIGFAAKTGHPFTPIGRVLIDAGELDREHVTMQSIRGWLADHPDRQDAVMWQNRSFIFFAESAIEDPADGPIGAAKVPLTAGRSLAVDREIHTFGMPVHVAASDLTHLDEGTAFARLMVAQDTGSAIVGPARGDIFVGSGSDAGELAGSVRNSAQFHFLLPLPAARRLL